MSELETLLSRSPEATLSKQDSGQKKSFLSVADGYAPSYPGITGKGELHCIKKNHKFEMIWAGSDAIGCVGQQKLAAQVNDFAREYNTLLKQQLIKLGTYECSSTHLLIERQRLCRLTGQSSCTGEENWTGAFRALNELVGALESTKRGYFGYRPERLGEYWLYVQNVEQREEVEKGACHIFPEYGIKMDVTIYVQLRHINERTKEWERENLRSIVCEY